MNGFLSARQPIGTDEENQTGAVWCGFWFDSTGFNRRYRIGSPSEAYHTGVDLNCNKPGFDSDKLAPVYSILDGDIIHARRFKDWGNLIVARYVLEDGKPIYARYAHVDSKTDGGLMVREGDRVERGQQIAKIGNAFNTMAYHLHYDLSPTEQLANYPADWPKLIRGRLLRDYIDPLIWHRVRQSPPMGSLRLVEVTTAALNIRTYPSTTATRIIPGLEGGDRVWVVNDPPVQADGHIWQRLDGDPINRWIAIDYTKQVDARE